MPLIPVPIEDVSSTGMLMGMYGETGCGKTTSIFSYMPGRMLYINVEFRNAGISVKTSGRNLSTNPVQILRYTNFDELKAFLEDMDNFVDFDVIVVDSISQLMNVYLSREIEDETFGQKSDDKKKSKGLILQTKKDVEGWGALSGQMYRLITPLVRLSGMGKVVICTFLHDSSPSWGRSYVNAPLVDGKKFGDNMGQFFDYICWLESRFDGDGNTVYPPLAHFHGMPDTYCKWTGTLPDGAKSAIAPLDMILKYIMTSVNGKYADPREKD